MPSLGEFFGMLKGYARDALPGGSLNPETRPISDMVTYASGALDPQSKISRDAQAWHQKTQRGLKDQLAGKQTPEAEYAYNQLMNMVGVAPLGMTAWHGSPHKFDKFSLDKIGTGEGAQAYGHGLYLAESPDVAKDYAGALSAARANKPIGNVDLQQVYQNLPNDVPDTLLAARRDFRALNESGELSATDRRDFLEAVKGNITASKGGSLYKTDIPDEAVARFLDWDKPLSQQAPEVQAALRQHMGQEWDKAWENLQGVNAYDVLANGRHSNPSGNVDAANKLRAAGIPGIRYLDGGSRSAGQGSSNFVVFDPEMIRILERNGQATGLQPWKPGEYKLRDLLTN